MKVRILKQLHQIMIDIVKANDKELDKIGVQLAEIEKMLINYTSIPQNKK